MLSGDNSCFLKDMAVLLHTICLKNVASFEQSGPGLQSVSCMYYENLSEI